MRASQLSESELERMMVTEETELARLGTQMDEKGFHVGSKAPLIFIYITESEIHVRHSSKSVGLSDTEIDTAFKIYRNLHLLPFQ